MKNHNNHYRRIIPALLIALGLGCLSLSPAARAENDDEHGPSIVGLWHVFYSGDLVFESFDQWWSDGLEWESANLGPGVLCQGTFKQRADGTIKLFHVNWNYDQNGVLVGYTNETQIDKLDPSGNSYHGTYHFKDYDVTGHLVSEERGTLRATRLTVNTPP
jgi:hypothetical protein